MRYRIRYECAETKTHYPDIKYDFSYGVSYVTSYGDGVDRISGKTVIKEMILEEEDFFFTLNTTLAEIRKGEIEDWWYLPVNRIISIENIKENEDEAGD